MRRWIHAVVIATATLAGLGAGATTAQAAPVPAAASSADLGPADLARALSQAGDSGWVPIIEPPFDRAAGVLCDFAIHADPIVNQAKLKVLQTNPDGSVRSELGTGALVYRVTNVSTGAHIDVDSSDSVLIVFNADGSLQEYASGPAIGLFPAGSGNLPRGLYSVDAPFFTVFVQADGYKTLTVRHGKVENVCPRLA
jgi:hypothetical protein